MPIFQGAKKSTRFYAGSRRVVKLYQGSKLVWFPNLYFTPVRYEWAGVEQRFTWLRRVLLSGAFSAEEGGLRWTWTRKVLLTDSFLITGPEIRYKRIKRFPTGEFEVIGQDLRLPGGYGVGYGLKYGG